MTFGGVDWGRIVDAGSCWASVKSLVGIGLQSGIEQQNKLVKCRRIHSAHSSEVTPRNHTFLVQHPVHALRLNRRIEGSIEKKLERTTQEADRQKEPTFTITKLIDDDIFKHISL